MNHWIRDAFGTLARTVCERWAKDQPPPRIIYDREGGSVYLERYYIFGGPTEEGVWQDTPIGVCLHRFLRSDDDNELHNHPWEAAASFILAGGYVEERRQSDDLVSTSKYEPFSFNILFGDTFHRVDLLERDAWSLFVYTRKTQSWGFWDRVTKVFTPWREFIAKKRGVDPASIDDNVRRSEEVGR